MSPDNARITEQARSEKKDATVALTQVEAANDLIVRHVFPWCRARLLHALAGADAQGVLLGVLEELDLDLPTIGTLQAALSRWRPVGR